MSINCNAFKLIDFRQKLEELGILCGLMPDLKHTSECLHRIVSLIGGIGDDPYAGMH